MRAPGAPETCAARAAHRVPCAALPSASARRVSSGPARSCGQFRYVHPPTLLPALLRELHQLHALGAFAQRPLERRIVDDVADEVLPLHLESIVVIDRVGYELPSVVEVDRLRDVRVPHGLRRVDTR